MGVNFKAYALIGVKVDGGKLADLGCEHDKPDTAKYCPECGKPVVYGVTEDNVAGYQVVYGTHEDYAYICLHQIGDGTSSNGGDDDQRVPIPLDITAAAMKMQNALGPLGLWDQKQFGLWSVLCCH